LTRGRPNAHFRLFALLLIVVQFCFLYSAFATREAPFGEDQDAYLDAVARAQSGQSYFDGQKNPLLPVVLAVLVPQGAGSFTASVFWVILITVMMTLGQLIWARKLWGEGAALLWAYFLAFNSIALDHGAMVMVEAWLIQLVAFFLLAWSQAMKSQSRRDWCLVGLFLGMTLLAKGTMPVFLLAVALSLLLTRRFKTLITVMGVTLAVYLPFLIYRALAFGDPFYQVSQGLSWLGFYHPSNLEGSSLSQFIKEEGVTGLFTRLFEGLKEIPTRAISALGPISSSPRFSLLFLLALFALSLRQWKNNLNSPVAAIRNLPRETQLLAVFVFGLFVLFCAWMAPVASVSRYFVPLVPLGAGALVLCWGRPEINKSFVALIAVVTVLFLPWPKNLTAEVLVHPGQSWQQDARYKDYLAIRLAVEKEAGDKKDLVIFYGPGNTLPRSWLWELTSIGLPYGNQPNKTEIFETLKKADYWVFDDDTRKTNGQLFYEFSTEVIKQSPSAALIEIEGFRLKFLGRFENQKKQTVFLYRQMRISRGFKLP
jgi:hypothetical protein